jgi:hypothetical protein
MDLCWSTRRLNTSSPRDCLGWRPLSPQDILKICPLWRLMCFACITSRLEAWISLFYWIHFSPGLLKYGRVWHNTKVYIKALVAWGAEGELGDLMR